MAIPSAFCRSSQGLSHFSSSQRLVTIASLSALLVRWRLVEGNACRGGIHTPPVPLRPAMALISFALHDTFGSTFYTALCSTFYTALCSAFHTALCSTLGLVSLYQRLDELVSQVLRSNHYRPSQCVNDTCSHYRIDDYERHCWRGFMHHRNRGLSKTRMVSVRDLFPSYEHSPANRHHEDQG